jgi:hypothetical protein
MGTLSEGEPWVSFTNLKIETYRMSSPISICLNPMYDGYFPWTTRVYDSWLKSLWFSVSSAMNTLYRPMITTQRGMLIFALAP